MVSSSSTPRKDTSKPATSKFAVAGNAPLIVAKRDGKISLTGTGCDIQHYIEEFVKKM